MEKHDTKTKALVAILAMCSLMMSNTAIAPLLNEASVSYPDAGMSAIQLIYSITMLAQLPTMLLAGSLTKKVSKKSLSFIGLGLVALGGALPLWLHATLVRIYAASALIGAGCGIINIVGSTLISDYYDGVEKGRIMGYQSAAISVLGGAMSFASGIIASDFIWWASFLLFLVAVPILIVVAVCLPPDTPTLPSDNEPSGSYSKDVVVWAILAFLFGTFMYAFQNNISMFLSAEGFGGAEVAGYVSTMLMLIGIPGGLLLGFVLRKLKRRTVWVSGAVLALGMMVIAWAPSIEIVYAGTLLYGLGFALRNPGIITFTAYLAPGKSTATAIALVQAAATVCGFASPFAVNAVAALLGGDFRLTFTACGIILLAITAAYVVLNPVADSDIEDPSVSA